MIGERSPDCASQPRLIVIVKPTKSFSRISQAPEGSSGGLWIPGWETLRKGPGELAGLVALPLLGTEI